MKKKMEILTERIMMNVYADFIRKGIQTLSNVPEHLRNDVSVLLR